WINQWDNLDGAVEVVPLIDPADRRVWLLPVVDTGDRLLQAHPTQESENAIENTSIIARRDDQVLPRTGGLRGNPERIGLQICLDAQRRALQIRDGGEND